MEHVGVIRVTGELFRKIAFESAQDAPPRLPSAHAGFFLSSDRESRLFHVRGVFSDRRSVRLCRVPEVLNRTSVSAARGRLSPQTIQPPPQSDTARLPKNVHVIPRSAASSEGRQSAVCNEQDCSLADNKNRKKSELARASHEYQFPSTSSDQEEILSARRFLFFDL